MSAAATTQARDTLLRALEQLEQAETDLGTEPTRVDLIVIYSIGYESHEDWNEISGWACTPGPKWLHAALLQRAADAQHNDIIPADDEPDEDTQ